MADVLTIIGAKDTEFTGVVQKMVSTVRRAKNEIEAMPIHIGAKAGMPGGAGGMLGGDPTAGNPFYTGVRLAGYGNPLFASAFRNRAMLEQIEARIAASGVGGGEAAAGGMRMAGMGGALGTVGAVGAALAALNRGGEKIRELGTAQEKWKKETEATVQAYGRLASAITAVQTSVQKARAEATAEAQRRTAEIAESGMKNMEALDGGSFLRRWMRGSVINASAYLSRTPGVAGALGYDKETPFYGDQAEKQAKDAMDLANRNAASGNTIIQDAEGKARAKELEDAQEKFITNGRLLSQQSEAQQREAEARAKEIAQKEKAKQLASEDLRVSMMQQDAVRERLNGREKEAQLLEANASFLQRHLELERDLNLSTQEKSEAQMQAWEIYQLQNATIEKDFASRSRRSYSFDGSQASGAAGAVLANASYQDRLLKKTEEMAGTLKVIAKNTGEPRVAVFG